MVNAEMDAMVFGGTEAEQLQRDIEQRLNIGHTHQSETNLFAAVWTAFPVASVCLNDGGVHLSGELTTVGFFLLGLDTQG
ncbi:hypothetical protein D3C76_1790920 [compost metagenome]